MHQLRDRYTIDENILTVGDKAITFKNPIREAIEIADMLILLTMAPKETAANRNVFGVSLTEKEVKWQVGKINEGTDENNCPFVGIKYYNNQLYLNNWCDIYLIVDPLTGEILERSLPAKS